MLRDKSEYLYFFNRKYVVFLTQVNMVRERRINSGRSKNVDAGIQLVYNIHCMVICNWPLIVFKEITVYNGYF